MNYIVRKPWDLPQSQHTPIEIFKNRRLHRREFLQSLGLASAGLGLGTLNVGCARPSEEEVRQAGAVEPIPVAGPSIYPAKHNQAFEYGRTETAQRDAAEFCNFYEFTGSKSVWEYVAPFQPYPWSVEITGDCANPQTWSIDDFYEKFSIEERAYRHRCVETWAMCVPWTGFPLRDLLKAVEPNPGAKYVAFETALIPDQMPHAQPGDGHPWPYTEGLTIEEAQNELAFVALGVYGEQLPKQHGAPIRLVVPWKYGFKSIKSIVKITLTDKAPHTFWNTLSPHEYAFEANVDPEVDHPRWSQRTEWMLGSRERFETQKYNGYGDYVAKLYKA